MTLATKSRNDPATIGLALGVIGVGAMVWSGPPLFRTLREDPGPGVDATVVRTDVGRDSHGSSSWTVQLRYEASGTETTADVPVPENVAKAYHADQKTRLFERSSLGKPSFATSETLAMRRHEDQTFLGIVFALGLVGLLAGVVLAWRWLKA